MKVMTSEEFMLNLTYSENRLLDSRKHTIYIYTACNLELWKIFTLLFNPSIIVL